MSETTRDRAIYCGTSIGSRMRSVAWWHSNDLDGP